jgi:iron complex transport system permease protein
LWAGHRALRHGGRAAARCPLAWALGRGLDGLAWARPPRSSLGLPLAPMRALLVAVLALATGTAVAQTGLIAFVGLAAPHLVRSWSRLHARPLVLLSAAGRGCC